MLVTDSSHLKSHQHKDSIILNLSPSSTCSHVTDALGINMILSYPHSEKHFPEVPKIISSPISELLYRSIFLYTGMLKCPNLERSIAL